MIIVLLLVNCSNDNQKETTVNEKEYKELGQKYAMATQAVLGKNLTTTIKNKGTVEAITFCNHQAYPLTDSMAASLNTRIKRVSDKPRNPMNKANNSELEYIALSKQKMEQDEEIEPKIQTVDKKTVAYYPIITNAMCLQCHGKPTTNIKAEIQNKLNELYPADKATGYESNQLRGIWVIEMDEK